MANTNRKYLVSNSEEVPSYWERTKSRSLAMICIDTGNKSWLRNLPIDVYLYLKQFSKLERGFIYNKWKTEHNFNEYVRYRFKKENFKF